MQSILIALVACAQLAAPHLAGESARVGAKIVPPRTATYGVGGLMPLRALSALPPGGQRAHSGYPGSKLRAGVFQDAKAWRAFVAKAGDRYRRLQVDWRRQMIAYVVFDGRTNALRFGRWVLPRRGKAELQFHWIGIEPAYGNATPGLFRVVPRRGVKTIAVRQLFRRAPHRRPSSRVLLTIPVR